MSDQYYRIPEAARYHACGLCGGNSPLLPSANTGQVVVPQRELRIAGSNTARHRETTIRLYIHGKRWLEEPLIVETTP
ncbi:hypothetical protein [Verrucomicrobium spinosum]|uniref:hypothetical protein n=1 Tax=Verrucomicrobium spinosum TaxID=2736 RepID=UPI0012F64F15|nr:hypothetical protein [Verrucomicrobium spinosum]